MTPSAAYAGRHRRDRTVRTARLRLVVRRAVRWLPSWLAVASSVLAAAPLPAGTGAEPVRVERTVFLMGTLATFVAETADRETALAKLERMVRVVEHTEAELSTWRQDSVLSAVNRQPPGEPLPLPVRTCRLLARVASWRAATGGAFDPAIGSLIEAWDLRGAGRRPTVAALEAARAAAGFGHLALDVDSCVVARRAAVTLDAGAFGKGEALDRVRAAERGRPGTWRIDFGGQMAVSGEASGGPWVVGVAHPARRDVAVLELSLAAGSLATSGGSERDLRLDDGVRIGHLIDPRSGRPVSRSASVTVWHGNALVADILSTALYVMGPLEGIAWAESHGIAACFISVDPDSDDVIVRATQPFAARFPPPLVGPGTEEGTRADRQGSAP